MKMIYLLHSFVCKKLAITRSAFSLVEMLMALLVASLLMAAMAPVMTKKYNDSISVGGELPSAKVKKHEINYGDDNCSEFDIVNNTCKGEFKVPSGYNGRMSVTAIGGGGVGGTSSTTGSIEYKSAGTYTFIVPAGVNELEVTLVSGGAGGGAGGQMIKTARWTAANDYTWPVPKELMGKYALFKACGAGGGAGSGVSASQAGKGSAGSGAYTTGAGLLSNTITSLDFTIGGGGGAGNHSTGNRGTHNGGYGGSGDTPSPSPTTTRFGHTPGRGGNGDWLAGVQVLPTTGGDASHLHAGSAMPGICHSSTINTFNCATGGRGGELAGGGGGGGMYSGGGGGGGATAVFKQDGARSIYSSYIVASGGGGTGGSYALEDILGPSGGGGGGNLGGRGGPINFEANQFSEGGRPNGSPLTSVWGHVQVPIVERPDWGTYYRCGGGVWGVNNGNGFDGALDIDYLSYGPGGSGGGAAAIVPTQRIKVRSGEVLTINVGTGGNAQIAGYINSSGTLIQPNTRQLNNFGQESYISRNSNKILRTNNNEGYAAIPGCYNGTILGNALCGGAGWVHDGIYNPFTEINVAGFSSQTGKSAGNGTTSGDIAYANGSIGGTGGRTTLFNSTSHCTPGAGGTSSSPLGKDAVGYGGCAGGGGYGLSDGGKGAPGYARITWNPNKVGTGGGGGSANYILKHQIDVKSGSVIKYQIAEGGDGGYIEGNTIVDGQYGADTIFGTSSLYPVNYKITAGGGYGGKSSTISGSFPNTILSNGLGGNKANICKIANTNMTICTDNMNGSVGTNIKGEDAPSNNLGSGGGGSGIVDYGISTSNPSTNTTKGGKGASGKILLEWYE